MPAPTPPTPLGLFDTDTLIGTLTGEEANR